MRNKKTQIHPLCKFTGFIFTNSVFLSSLINFVILGLHLLVSHSVRSLRKKFILVPKHRCASLSLHSTFVWVIQIITNKIICITPFFFLSYIFTFTLLHPSPCSHYHKYVCILSMTAKNVWFLRVGSILRNLQNCIWKKLSVKRYPDAPDIIK